MDDERRPFVIGGNGADFAAVEYLADVEVAERCPGNRAAFLGLLPHLVLDVGVGSLDLVLIDGMQDGLHHLAFQGVAEVNDGGDDPDVQLTEVALGERSINGVAENAVEMMDNNKVDILLGLDAGHHFLEDGAFLDFSGAPSGLDVFVHN